MLRKGLVSLAGLALAMGALIFVPAGTLDYWQAWLFVGCYFGASVVVSLWLMRNDPALLERRMRGGPLAEGERNQNHHDDHLDRVRRAARRPWAR